LEKLLGNKNENSGSESSDSKDNDPKDNQIDPEKKESEVEVISDKDIGTKQFYDILYGFYGQRNKKVIHTKEKEIIDPSGLIKSYGISADINIAGLKKAKDKNWENRYRNFQSNSKQAQYEMQDTHFCECQFYNESALFCVFDGHLGSNCSRDLITIFPQSLKQYFKDIITNIDDIQYAWKTLYLNVDNSLRQYEVEGSTATTVFIWKSNGKKFLQCANVGDSTAFLYRSGVPVPLSKDHKLNNQSGERERLVKMGIHVEKGALRVEGGLNVTRAFGDFYPKENGSGIISEPEVSTLIELTDKDTHIIVASDGLWDVLTPEEAYTIISGFDDSKVMSHQLLSTALLNQNCKDNVTVVVVSLL
jgi:serine/threonine protein phosphatase PrpC